MTSLDKILVGLDDQIRTTIVILGAYRDNPFAARAVAQAGTSRSVAASAGLAAPAKPGIGATLGAGTLIAFATAPGPFALDGRARQPVFHGTAAAHRNARARSPTDAHPGARGCCNGDQQQAGPVVQFIAPRRGLPGRQPALTPPATGRLHLPSPVRPCHWRHSFAASYAAAAGLVTAWHISVCSSPERV
jgi:hypothetical protein